MFMKKIVLILSCVAMLVSCDNSYNIIEEPQNYELPKTRVYALGQSLDNVGTKSSYVWPFTSEDGTWETARFSIRADNTAPDFYDHSSTLYFGRKPGKDGKNRGRVYTGYPYGHYNDRDFDYTKVDKKTGYNIGLFRFVFDRKGLKTQLAIAEAPKVMDILDDEKTDLEAEIAAGKNVTKNQQNLDKVKALMDLGNDYLESHVAWYVVKEVGGARLWHVNGYIADFEPGKPGDKKLPDELEIDIHQQEHLDWSEIKTSIHVRMDVEALEVNIPLDLDDIVEQDDFDIRIYKSYYKTLAEVTTETSYTITHDEKGITIRVDNIDPTMIEELMNQYCDGLTIEVFSYTTSNHADIWEKVKKSTVKTKKPCTPSGQITSAYYDDTALIRVDKALL